MISRKGILGGIGLLTGAAIVVVLFLQFNQSSKPAARTAPPPVPVSIAPVVAKTMQMRLTAIGNIEAYTTVAVKARIDGQIDSVHFKEGDEVRQGALLFEIDPRPLQATLRQAQANLLRDKALLERARTQEIRYKDLLEKKFISQDAYEQARANLDAAQATVSADQAANDSAALQLGFCSIRSPVTGYAGKIMIQKGNLIKANDAAPLVVINQVVPVFATFSVPEQYLAEIRANQAKGELKVAANLANSEQPPVLGRITFIDNSTDLTTGTIKLKASFPNVDKALWPGQFVNIGLVLREQPGALVLPTAALQNGPGGQYVYVVKPDMTVELRNIKIDRTEGNDTVVASGLAAGDQVVTEGQLRLAQGSRVSTGKDAGKDAPKEARKDTGKGGPAS